MKVFNVFIITILCLTFLSTGVYAQSLTLTRIEDINVDTSIISEGTSYTTPDSIIIAPLFAPTNLNVQSEERYRGIFHYTIDRLGFNDIPFHYVVTPSGEIIEGNSSGDESRVVVSNFAQNPVVVSYITDQFSNQFDERALDSIKELTTNIANTNGINISDIEVKEMQFIRDRETRAVTMEVQDLFGSWNTQRDEIVSFVGENYSPESKPYTVEVVEVSVPTDTVNPGEVVQGSITVRNTGQYGLYPLTNSEMLLTKADNSTSTFFVNNDWESQSQVSLFENEGLPPGDEATFTFPLYVPLFLGEQLETFKLTTALGSTVDSEEFEISLNVAASDRQIISVRDRGFDFYPVYAGPNTTSTEVFRAVAGQRFFFLQDLGNGWYEIDLGNSQTGWIAFWNVDFVN